MSRSFQTFLFETQGCKRINPLRINPLRINPLRLFTKLCRLKLSLIHI